MDSPEQTKDRDSTLLRYSGVRVGVLGASGFIGRWVARALSRQGADLVLVVRDRHSTELLADSYDFRGEIVEMDIVNVTAVSRLFERIRPTITFNLAAYGVDTSERDEQAMQAINVELVETVADAVASVRNPAWRGQTLVQVGSALEYGSTRGELSEDSPANPVNSYGRSKLAATGAVSRRAAQTGLRAITARLFTVYGPGEHRGRLLPSLIEAARNGTSLALTSGDQQRDFCYVGDVAEGLLRLGLSDAAPGETLNLATGRLTSVRSFALLAAQTLSIPAERLEFGAIPAREDEMWQGRVNVDRFERITGWLPPTGIEEGIRRTWELESLPSDASGLMEIDKLIGGLRN